MGSIINELCLILQNKKCVKPNDGKGPSLEQLLATIVNKECLQPLKTYTSQNINSKENCDVQMKHNALGFYNLLKSILLILMFFMFDYIIYDSYICLLPFSVVNLWRIMYALIMGTLWTSLFIISHECAHETFFNSSNMNNMVGFILCHSMLLPYYGLKYSHQKHHKYNNHILYEENHNPYLLGSPGLRETYHIFIKKLYDISPRLQVLASFVLTVLFGLPLYLLTNLSGGKVLPKTGKPITEEMTKDHFRSSSILFDCDQKRNVRMSTLTCFVTLLMLYIAYCSYGFYFVLDYYCSPLIVTYGWIVWYSLYDTSSKAPHFSDDCYNRLKGDLMAHDREGNNDKLHFDYGNCRVIHYANNSIPYYARSYVKPFLKDCLTEEKLGSMYDNISGIYENYKKLFAGIKIALSIVKELGIICDSKSEDYLTQIINELDRLDNKNFFKRVCLNKTDFNMVIKLRAVCEKIKEYNKRLEETFIGMGITFDMDNLVDIVRMFKNNKNLDINKMLTKERFIEWYSYKIREESTEEMLKDIFTDCSHVNSLEGTIYYKSLADI